MQKRVIWKMFALEVITLGIYRLYWFIKTRREMMDTDKSIQIMTPWFLIIPVVLIVVSFIAMMAGTINSASNLPSTCKDPSYSQVTRANDGYVTKTTRAECEPTPPAAATIALIVSALAFWPVVVIWLWGYCKGVETITAGKMHFALTLIILVLVPDGIDILIVQDTFNKVGDTTPQSPTPVAAS